MELKKKYLYSIISIVITIFSTPLVFAMEDATIDSVVNKSMNVHHYTDSNGIHYEYDANFSTASIIDYLGTDKNITIPSSIMVEENNYIINTIEDWAFSNKELSNVKIPNSITNIGNWAFYSNNLSNVVIPNSVETIGNGAFNQNELTILNIPTSITTIESNAFSDNQLSNINIPNSVRTIGVSSFENNLLTDVSIPSSVTTIRERAFTNNLLSNIVIPNSVTSIETAAFQDNLLYDILIPSSISSIGNWCFMGNPLQTIYTDTANSTHLKGILNPQVMFQIKADSTSILESPAAYTSSINLENTLSIGDSIVLEAIQQIQYVYNHSSSTWNQHIPTIQWFKDGQPLVEETKLTLTLANIDVKDAGIYYTIIDDVVLPEIQIKVTDDTLQSPAEDVNKSLEQERKQLEESKNDDIHTGDHTKGIIFYATGGLAALGYIIFCLFKTNK